MMPVPYYQEAGVTLYCGDNLEVLRQLDPEQFTACITDPPYGLGKEPDALAMLRDWMENGHHDVASKGGFMGKEWDSFVPQPSQWKEIERVLLPGAHLMSFAGTRTMDLVSLGIRIAGFELRDSIGYLNEGNAAPVMAWVYGSGFPKSLNVSQAIEKEARGCPQGSFDTAKRGRGDLPARNALAMGGCNGGSRSGLTDEYEEFKPSMDSSKPWDGYGTALKPAHEPIILARKPLIGTVVENVQKYGCGALNIDGCRIEGEKSSGSGQPPLKFSGENSRPFHDNQSTREFDTSKGRWPANIVHDGSEDVEAGFPHTISGEIRSSHVRTTSKTKNAYSEREALPESFGGSSGSASRFFYCAKTSKSERGIGNNHPTVKPQELMRWLLTLVKMPERNLILDPWGGSGSTAIAARFLGMPIVIIEREKEYCDLIIARLNGKSHVHESIAEPTKETKETKEQLQGMLF